MDELNKTRRLPAFSEIAVAMAVVAVVTAVVFPVICKAQQQAEDSSTLCMSNMKQLTLGTMMYTQDYDGLLPASYKGAPQSWAGRTFPYIASTKTYRCPDDPTNYDWGLKSAGCPVSYAMNADLKKLTPTSRQDQDKGIAFSEMHSPMRTVLFFEVANDQAQVSLTDEGTGDYTKPPTTSFVSAAGNGSGARPAWGYLGNGASTLEYATGKIGGRAEIIGQPRHHGGSNFAAMDGHVVWLPAANVSGGTTNPSPRGVQDQPPGAAAGTEAGYSLTFSPR